MLWLNAKGSKSESNSQLQFATRSRKVGIQNLSHQFAWRDSPSISGHLEPFFQIWRHWKSNCDFFILFADCFSAGPLSSSAVLFFDFIHTMCKFSNPTKEVRTSSLRWSSNCDFYREFWLWILRSFLKSLVGFFLLPFKRFRWVRISYNCQPQLRCLF